MKTDIYTKAMLTVIALCLVVLTLRETPLISTANAQGYRDGVRITGVDSYAFQYAGPLHVICDRGCEK